jgi:hypothetical protein
MAMLPLSDSRVAVIFAEHVLNDQIGLKGGAMYGSTLLAKVHPDGQMPEVISKDRFASGPVARLSATELSPSSFAIAYRQGQTEPDAKQAEAACIAGQVYKNHIQFNAPAVLLEPESGNIWSRSLSRVGANLLAYTYHSGNDKVTKQAILKMDPSTHRLDIAHGPEVLEHGHTPFVGSVALVPQPGDLEKQNTGPFPLSLAQRHRGQSARLLTYIAHDEPKPTRARLCGISDGGAPAGCQEIALAGRSIASAAGTPISDGRFVFVFTDSQGSPYYQFMGLMDPLI